MIKLTSAYLEAAGARTRTVIDSLLSGLRDEYAETELTPGKALASIGEPALMPLLGMLWDWDRQVREGAAGALGMIGSSRAVEPLLAALRDHDWNVQQAAALSLGMIGDARAVEPLAATLGKRNLTLAAAQALGAIGDARAIGPLLAVSHSRYEHSIVRQTVLEALSAVAVRLGAPAVVPIVAALRKLDDLELLSLLPSVVEVLVLLGAPVVDRLVILLRDENWLRRMAAAMALGRIGSTRAVNPLLAMLDDDDEDENVRRRAAEALGEIGDAAAIKPLEAMLAGGPQHVHAAVVEALSRLGGTQATATTSTEE